MNIAKLALTFGIAGLALASCTQGPPVPTIGPAGGTATAQDGAQVIVPAGALSGQVPIAITLTSSGAPELPDDHDGAGPVYALTPHGTTFLKPVTVQVPYQPKPSTAGLTPGSSGTRLLKTNAQGDWFELSANLLDGAEGQMLSAEVSTFSYLTTTTSRRQPNSDGLYRTYSMYAIPYSGNDAELVVSPPESAPVGDLAVDYQFGGAPFLDDGVADGEIYSNTSGSTYWAYAEAPGNEAPEHYAGNEIRYDQAQSFRKEPGDATLKFIITAVRLQGGHYGGLDIIPYECVGSPVCDLKLFAKVTFRAAAWTSGTDRRVLHRSNSHVVLASRPVQVAPGQPVWSVSTGHSGRTPLWSLATGDFTFSDMDREGFIALDGPVEVAIDLTDVPDGAFVTLDMSVEVETLNQIQGETYITGFFRDPIALEGTSIEYSGLTPVADLQEPIEEEQAPECTTAIDPAAGTIQFAAAEVDMLELPVGIEFAVVSREGGNKGDVSVRVRSHDGSAVVGDDYLGLDQVVFFADGDDSPRWVELELVADDLREPTEELTLRLSDPRGCAGLGTPSVATINIYDNDTPRDPTADLYTVGGTVTGLQGSGLVLSGFGYVDLTLDHDGPFVFPQAFPSGTLYDIEVKLQPTNPAQSCSVSNGTGQLEDDDVTDVVVTCGPPLEVSPYLDTTFALAGKATGPLGLGDDVVEVLVQSDGKILVLDEGKLSRFTASGAVDTAFGSGGSVAVAFHGTSYDVARAMALQTDGKIVVVGDTQLSVVDDNGNDWAAARFTASGAPDTSFGGAGTGVIVGDLGSTPGAPYHEAAYAVAIQPDGKIVLGGGLTRFNLGSDFLVLRLTSAGVLDAAFGSGGVAQATDIAGNTDIGRLVGLQSDGKIVIGGRVAPSGGSDPDIGMLRYGADGDLDTTFGDQGVMRDLTDDWDEPFDMLVLSDDSVVVVGSLNRLPADGGPTGLIARYTGAGTPDSGFSSDGRATVDELVSIRSVARQADGKYLVVGWAVPIGAGDYDFVLMRLNADGSVDTAFGDEGMVAVDFYEGIDSATAVAVQPDGKILVTGKVTNGTTTAMGLMRVMP